MHIGIGFLGQAGSTIGGHIFPVTGATTQALKLAFQLATCIINALTGLVGRGSQEFFACGEQIVQIAPKALLAGLCFITRAFQTEFHKFSLSGSKIVDRRNRLTVVT